MRSINDLDKELIKADKADVDTIHSILAEMDNKDMPAPDLTSIKNAVFSRYQENQIIKDAITRKIILHVRLLVLGSAVMAFLFVLTTRILTGQTPLFYLTMINLFFVVGGGIALAIFCPRSLESIKEA